MPFQSEKQRRYLWANEPEIARDWTDTYGSGIAKALGGRIGFYRGSDRHAGTSSSSRSYGPPGSASRASAPTHQPAPDREPAPDRSGPINIHADTAPVIAQQRQTEFLNEARRQQAEKDYTRQGVMKPGPQLGLTRSGIGGGLGDWASQFAGSKIGGGLGSMLFGPWGMLLGSLFGRGVGKRGYQAYQTKDKKESLQDILLGENTILSSMFNKRINEQPRREGIERIDMSDQRGDDRTLMAGVKDMSTAQQFRFRNLDMQNKLYQGNGIGEPLTLEENQELEQLRNLRNSGLISAEGNPIA